MDIEGDISILVLDMNGGVVEVLFNGFSEVGHNSVNWDASNSPSGVYFVKLISEINHKSESSINKIIKNGK